MNYRRLLNTLRPELPKLELVGNGFGTGLLLVTERYPEGIEIGTNWDDDIVVVTGDAMYNFHSDTIKAISYFVSRCHKQPPTEED